MAVETRLGRIRGYDPTAEQAFTRREPGQNPIGLELNRLAALRGLPTTETRSPYRLPPDQEKALDDALAQWADDEQARRDTETQREMATGRRGDLAQNLPNEAYMLDMQHQGAFGMDPMDEYQARTAQGDYFNEAYDRMSPSEQDRFTRLDHRVGDLSEQITDYARTHPGFHIDENGISGDDVSPEDQATMDRLMHQRERVINRLGHLQDRAHNRGQQ